MPLYTNIGGTRKEITSLYPNIGGARKSMAAMYANIDGAQKQIFTNQKTVQLSTLSAGDSFYLTDSEGFSEYKLIKKATDYTSGSSSPISVVMAVRVNALDVNILSAVKTSDSDQPVYYGAPVITLAVNKLSAVSTYKNSINPYTYNMFIPNEDGNYIFYPGNYNYSARVFLGTERLINFNIATENMSRDLTFYSPSLSSYPNDVANTKSKSDVYCYYNHNTKVDFSDSTCLDYRYYRYFVHSGTRSNAYTRVYSSDVYAPSYTYTHHGYPSSLYFRPHVIFAANKEVTILIP